VKNFPPKKENDFQKRNNNERSFIFPIYIYITRKRWRRQLDEKQFFNEKFLKKNDWWEFFLHAFQGTFKSDFVNRERFLLYQPWEREILLVFILFHVAKFLQRTIFFPYLESIFFLFQEKFHVDDFLTKKVFILLIKTFSLFFISEWQIKENFQRKKRHSIFDEWAKFVNIFWGFYF